MCSNKTSPGHSITKEVESIIEISSVASFNGRQNVYQHESVECGCPMNFAVFLPPAAAIKSLPVIYWLSGLTCTEQNFIQKSGFQKYAAEREVIVVAPDTSPRGVSIPGDDEFYDFGKGAGFYIDATEEPWKKHYRMYSYIKTELIEIINANFPVLKNKQSIMGHSMGGHGALILALKNPGLFTSVSAFAPICNSSKCPWGMKAFEKYLGEDRSTWVEYDATELTKTYNGPHLEILIDQGKSDQFLEKEQLLPENLVEAANKSNGKVSIVLNMRENYDHSYYFIATFIERHIAYHANKLRNQ